MCNSIPNILCEERCHPPASEFLTESEVKGMSGGGLCDPPLGSNEKHVTIDTEILDESEDEGKSADGVSQPGDAPINEG